MPQLITADPVLVSGVTLVKTGIPETSKSALRCEFEDVR